MSNRYSRRTVEQGFHAILMLRPFSQIFSAIAFLLLVRLLPEHDFGIYSLLLSSLAFIGLVLSLGIINTLQRFVPEYGKAKEFTRVKLIARTGMILRLCSIIILGTIAYGFREEINAILDLSEYEYLYFPLALLTLSHFQARILLVVLQGLMFQQGAFVAQIVFGVSKILGYALLLLLGLGLEVVLWVDLAGYLGMLGVLTWSYIANVVPLESGPKTLGSEERNRVLKYGVFYNFNDVGMLTIGRDIDNFFLAAFMNPIAVGAYAFANKFADIILRFNPINYFYTAIQPTFFTLNPVVDRVRIGIIYGIMIKFGYLIVFPMFAGVVVAIHPIINLVFAGRFLEFSWVIVAVMGFNAISTMGRPIGLVAQLCERADIVLYSKVFGLGNVALNIVMVPLYGIWGIIFATGVSVLFKDIFVWWFVRDIAHPRDLFYFLGFSSLTWGSYVVVGRMLENAITSDLLSICALAAVGLCWMLFYLRFAFRNAEEKILVHSVLRGNLRIAKLFGV